jgi:hypothetical protein
MLNFCGIVVAILKMATGRNFSMSGINSGHHYLPTYKILMISDNVEFLPPIFYAMFCQPFWKWQTSRKYCFQLCSKGGQSHILRGSKGVGVTIESYGKVEISYINVDNF